MTELDAQTWEVIVRHANDAPPLSDEQLGVIAAAHRSAHTEETAA